MKYCSDCGCKVYSGHCMNCHEETYILEQDMENDEHIVFSDEFIQKVKEQSNEAKKLRRNEQWK